MHVNIRLMCFQMDVSLVLSLLESVSLVCILQQLEEADLGYGNFQLPHLQDEAYIIVCQLLVGRVVYRSIETYLLVVENTL